MTYLSTYFKVGHKTTAEINALATASLLVGDNVYNTDIDKEEFWTGDVWTNDDCIVVLNNEGAAVAEGNIIGVDPDVTTTDACELINDIESDFLVGVVFRGGNNGDKIVVATKGRWKVLFVSAVTATTRQHIVTVSTTAGEANTAASKVSGVGGFGVISESYGTMPGDRLVYCWIQGSERF